MFAWGERSHLDHGNEPITRDTSCNSRGDYLLLVSDTAPAAVRPLRVVRSTDYYDMGSTPNPAFHEVRQTFTRLEMPLIQRDAYAFVGQPECQAFHPPRVRWAIPRVGYERLRKLGHCPMLPPSVFGNKVPFSAAMLTALRA